MLFIISKQSQPKPPNIYLVKTRAKSGIICPTLHLTLLAHVEPKTTTLALSNPTSLDSMQSEYDALTNNNTWSLASLPLRRVPIDYKCVSIIKEIPDGSVNKYKAMLIVSGSINMEFITLKPLVLSSN